MHDQSYSEITLRAMVRRSDFGVIDFDEWDKFRDVAVADGARFAANFGAAPVLRAFHVRKKATYGVVELPPELILRQLCANIRRLTPNRPRGRSFAIRTLVHFLREGVPYTIYRLDIKSFYESFDLVAIREQVAALHKLSPQSKAIFNALMSEFGTLGGSGLPRGMALSAVVADVMMREFDAALAARPGVYFYYRYVDDIVLVTNGSESQRQFLSWLRSVLPRGLHLNYAKTCVRAAEKKVQPVSPKGVPKPRFLFSFEYLGYWFTVSDPMGDGRGGGDGMWRDVRVDIAPRKVRKLKTRLVRSVQDFERSGDIGLLVDRMRFLTSNFSVREHATGKRKLAGIYYSYPMIDPGAEGLTDLDHFLRRACLSTVGRRDGDTMIPAPVRRRILSNGFGTGHQTRRYLHFSDDRILDIQECWRHE